MTKYYKIGDKFETHWEAVQFVAMYDGEVKDNSNIRMFMYLTTLAVSHKLLNPPYTITDLGTAPTAPQKPTFEEVWAAWKAGKTILVSSEYFRPHEYQEGGYVSLSFYIRLKAACECDDFSVEIV